MNLMKKQSWTGFNIVNNDGSEYNGESNNGLRHGKGKCSYVDGSTYDGDWVNGLYCGKGTLKMSDGYKYVGEWKDG